jgi:simple sugar transport system substrate-binding protein
MPNFLRGGLKDGYVKMSAYGPAVGAPAKAKADAIKAEMLKGGFAIFKGALKDNKGGTVIAAGKSLDQFDAALEGMNYLVEGVIGSIPG